MVRDSIAAEVDLDAQLGQLLPPPRPGRTSRPSCRTGAKSDVYGCVAYMSHVRQRSHLRHISNATVDIRFRPNAV